MMGNLFSPGKLLLTSEYVVLDGALALAVPTQWGQEFFFEETEDGNSRVFWEAYHQNSLWLSADIDYKTWNITSANLAEAAAFVVKDAKIEVIIKVDKIILRIIKISTLIHIIK